MNSDELLHENKLHLDCLASFVFNDSIKKNYEKYIVKYFDFLDHFVVNIIMPGNEAIAICPNTHYLSNYKSLKMEQLDTVLYSDQFCEFPAILWETIFENANKKLFVFKKIIHNLHSGLILTKKFNDFYLTMEIASHDKNKNLEIVFLRNAEELLNLGAYMYQIHQYFFEQLYNKKFPNVTEIILNDQQYYHIEKLLKKLIHENFFS